MVLAGFVQNMVDIGGEMMDLPQGPWRTVEMQRGKRRLHLIKDLTGHVIAIVPVNGSRIVAAAVASRVEKLAKMPDEDDLEEFYAKADAAIGAVEKSDRRLEEAIHDLEELGRHDDAAAVKDRISTIVSRLEAARDLLPAEDAFY